MSGPEKTGSGFYNVGGLGAFFGIDHVKLDRVAFREGLETIPFDGGKMHEHISRTIFFGNETVSFLIVKPLHFASHFGSPLLYKCRSLMDRRASLKKNLRLSLG